jgi:hypothetical protein
MTAALVVSKQLLQAREWEIQKLREWIATMQKDPGDCPIVACDNSCLCATATGMSTNGGCRCDEQKLRRAVQWWRRRAQFLQQTIMEMKHMEPPTREIAERVAGIGAGGR